MFNCRNNHVSIGWLCMCAKSLQLSLTLCNPVDHSVPDSSVGFSRQEYWSGLPFLSPGDLPDSGVEPMSSAWQVDSLLLCHVGSHVCLSVSVYLCLSLGFCFHYCHSCCIAVQDPDGGRDEAQILRPERAPETGQSWNLYWAGFSEWDGMGQASISP